MPNPEYPKLPGYPGFIMGDLTPAVYSGIVKLAEPIKDQPDSEVYAIDLEEAGPTSVTSFAEDFK